MRTPQNQVVLRKLRPLLDLDPHPQQHQHRHDNAAGGRLLDGVDGAGVALVGHPAAIAALVGALEVLADVVAPRLVLHPTGPVLCWGGNGGLDVGEGRGVLTGEGEEEEEGSWSEEDGEEGSCPPAAAVLATAATARTRTTTASGYSSAEDDGDGPSFLAFSSTGLPSPPPPPQPQPQPILERDVRCVGVGVRVCL
jgi:hypothetical protein